MALIGAHIVCGYTGGSESPRTSSVVPVAPITLLGPLAWSQTMAAGGTATKAAPSGAPNPVFEFYALVDCYVAWGPVPDVVNGPRVYFVAGIGVMDYLAQPGDKFAWATV